MVPPARVPIAAPDGARCSLHPDRPALLACSRCGAFICEEDQRAVDADLYCPSCAARPDVDYLEAFRLRYWGVRDAWAWLFGFGALVNAAIAMALVAAAEYLAAGLLALSAGVGVAFCAGPRWARYAPLAFSALLLAFWAVHLLLLPSADAMTGAAVSSGFSLLVAIGVYFDTRNRLFFKVPVSRRALQKSWNLYANNVTARQGFQLALLGLIVPGICLVALVLSIVGLRRVDRNAHPPIGRAGYAIAGIAISTITSFWWAFVLLYRFFREQS